MSALKYLGDFLQASLFGGTYEDVAFEVRVLKGEVARLHDRLDAEIARLHEKLDAMDGKPGKGKGRKRLTIMSAAEVADVKVEAAPVTPAPAPAASPAPAPLKAASGPFHGAMSIADAFATHPKAKDVFAAHHLPACTDCALSKIETLEAGARLHSLDGDKLLADLNRLVEA